jgi:hypothetical protein
MNFILHQLSFGILLVLIELSNKEINPPSLKEKKRTSKIFAMFSGYPLKFSSPPAPPPPFRSRETFHAVVVARIGKLESKK